VGALDEWARVMEESGALHAALAAAGLGTVAPYAVAMAHRVRYYMELNAREAMHMLELRTSPQGHPAYRRICQAMHRLIADQAGHRAIAAARRHVDPSGGDTGRIAAERASEARRRSTS
jgi:thymidylate synthase ThyX